MKIFGNILETAGNTPLVEISRRMNGTGARILVKIESFNPGGSAKDRVAVSMVEDAELSGRLRKGGTIVEPTSGNTGVALAMVAAVRGYALVLTMPETVSAERVRLAEAYGAEVVLTPGDAGMKGSIEKAAEIASSIPGSVILQQFENPANPSSHRESTGPEIWRDTCGNVDLFVAGVGTGGTLSGAGAFLKSKNPAIRVCAVEPSSSAVLSGGEPSAHQLQGIGAGFVPRTLDTGVVDEVFAVSDRDAFRTARELASKEGILCGISSGAALFAALELSGKDEWTGKTVVAVLPDTGERYLSTPLFG